VGSAAESGSNAGSDFWIARYTDAGALIDTPVQVSRATGLMTLLDGMSVTGAATFASAATFNGSVTANAGLTVIGAAGLTIRNPAGGNRVLAFNTGATNRWAIYANATAEGGSNAGSDFYVTRYNDAGAAIDTPLNINRATGLVALLDGLDVTGAAAFHGVTTFNTTDVVLSNGVNLKLSSAAGVSRPILFQTGASNRWAVYVNSTAESGSNVGSDFVIQRYTDAGAQIDAPILIGRNNGVVSIGPGGLSVPGGAPFSLGGPAGSTRGLYFSTGGLTRWLLYCNSTAEGGSNAGSDLFIGRYNDAGTFLDAPFTITRSTGTVTARGLTVLGALTLDGPILSPPPVLARADRRLAEDDWPSGVHFTESATLVIPDDLPAGLTVEITAATGASVIFNSDGPLRVLPPGRTASMTGPAIATLRRRGEEIWLAL
jgi:hypothetical protein